MKFSKDEIIALKRGLILLSLKATSEREKFYTQLYQKLEEESD